MINSNKNVIITGATGMIGRLILKRCLHSDKIGRVTIISRRSTGISNNKLVEVIHSDFIDFSRVESHFKDQDIVYFCLGVYTGDVNRERFRKITVDCTKAFADMLKRKSPEARFCFLSGMGADRSEKSRMMFAKDKGAAENYLIKMNFKQFNIFRPGYIYPVTPRKEPNISYRIMRFVYPVYKLIHSKGVITSIALAEVIFKTGLHGSDQNIFENKDLIKISSQM